MLINKCGNDCHHCGKEIIVLRPLDTDGEIVCIYIGCTTETRFEVALPKKNWLALSMASGNETKAESWLAARIHETATLKTETIESYLRIKLRDLLESQTA